VTRSVWTCSTNGGSLPALERSGGVAAWTVGEPLAGNRRTARNLSEPVFMRARGGRYGGSEKISAPASELKLIQRRLADLLQNCVDEINDVRGFGDPIAHGFKRKRSILTNAKRHRRRSEHGCAKALGRSDR
jgi:hypothetical protein